MEMLNYKNSTEHIRKIEVIHSKFNYLATNLWFVGFCVGFIMMFMGLYLMLSLVKTSNIWIGLFVSSFLGIVCLWVIPYNIGMIMYRRVMELEKELFQFEDEERN